METPVDLGKQSEESPFGFAAEDPNPDEMIETDLNVHDAKLGDFFSLAEVEH
jgi:hypothetical protein